MLRQIPTSAAPAQPDPGSEGGWATGASTNNIGLPAGAAAEPSSTDAVTGDSFYAAEPSCTSHCNALAAADPAEPDEPDEVITVPPSSPGDQEVTQSPSEDPELPYPVTPGKVAADPAEPYEVISVPPSTSSPTRSSPSRTRSSPSCTRSERRRSRSRDSSELTVVDGDRSPPGVREAPPTPQPGETLKTPMFNVPQPLPLPPPLLFPPPPPVAPPPPPPPVVADTGRRRHLSSPHPVAAAADASLVSPPLPPPPPVAPKAGGRAALQLMRDGAGSASGAKRPRGGAAAEPVAVDEALAPPTPKKQRGIAKVAPMRRAQAAPAAEPAAPAVPWPSDERTVVDGEAAGALVVRGDEAAGWTMTGQKREFMWPAASAAQYPPAKGSCAKLMHEEHVEAQSADVQPASSSVAQASKKIRSREKGAEGSRCGLGRRCLVAMAVPPPHELHPSPDQLAEMLAYAEPAKMSKRWRQLERGLIHKEKGRMAQDIMSVAISFWMSGVAPGHNFSMVYSSL